MNDSTGATIEIKRKTFEALKHNPSLQTANKLSSAKIAFTLKSQLSKIIQKPLIKTPIPLYQSRVSAGHPSSVQETIEQTIDLHQTLIQNDQASFCVRVEGESMIEAGIHENDLLVVDAKKEPRTGNIIIASVYGELTVKRLKILNNKIFLIPENSKFKILEITDDMNFTILGVVLHVIHSF